MEGRWFHSGNTKIVETQTCHLCVLSLALCTRCRSSDDALLGALSECVLSKWNKETHLLVWSHLLSWSCTGQYYLTTCLLSPLMLWPIRVWGEEYTLLEGNGTEWFKNVLLMMTRI